MKESFDKCSRASILNHAKKMLGKSLVDLYPRVEASNPGKGSLGLAVEEVHFNHKNDNVSQPDFPEAGVELKCTSLKKLKDGSIVSKDKLFLNIIDYIAEAKCSFTNSSFWRKNNFLLLMFYLYEKDQESLRNIFKIIREFDFDRINELDKRIIKDDWEAIRKKILDGKAHELSEGDTLYLAAGMKGSKSGREMRNQPFSTILAQQRAYCLKSRFVNTVVLDSVLKNVSTEDCFLSKATVNRILKKQEQAQRIVKNIEEYKCGDTFEKIVVKKFSAFYGKTLDEIETEIQKKRNIHISRGKARNYDVCRAILDVTSKKIYEVEASELRLKTLCLSCNGAVKESMSFKNINFDSIGEEREWEKSEFFKLIDKKFMFVVFREMGKKDALARGKKCDRFSNIILEKVFFWTMPAKDRIIAKAFWKDTRDKVKKKDFSSFWKISDNRMCHVRPKGKNKKDVVELADGSVVEKKSYWLNSAYIKKIVDENN